MSKKSRALVNRGKAKKQLNFVYLRDRGICQYCYQRCKREDASRGHIIDVEFCEDRQQANDMNNMQLEHTWCNDLKARNKEQARKILGELGPGWEKLLIGTITE